MTPPSLKEPPLSLRINTDGDTQWVYDERVDLSSLGSPHLRRASHVEPEADGSWWADLVPVNGPRLGPFACRSAALTAERAWLEAAAWRQPQSTEVASTPPQSLTQRKTQLMRLIILAILLFVLLSFVGCLDQLVVGSTVHASRCAPATRRSP
jgi:hypothetical protein